jgi:glycosyltransferase involved in cell wall biosynthesis
VGWYFTFGISVLRLYWLLLIRRPAIVHCFLPMANLLGVVLGRAAFIKHIVVTRRSLNRYQDRQPLLGALERRLLHSADVIVSNSRAAVRQLVEEESAPAERIEVIHNGISLSRMEVSASRSEIRKTLAIEDDALVFVIVANLIPYKGHLDLVAALSGIASSLPNKWVLLAAGRDEGASVAVLGAARDGNIEEHVRLLGPRTDVAHLLHASDIAMLCSHEEGFPTAIVEYMVVGLPVVSTDIGGTGEAVSDGETGVLVPVGDPQALGAALLRLAQDGETRRRMGEAGRRRALERFTLDVCVAAYDRLYSELLTRPR